MAKERGTPRFYSYSWIKFWTESWLTGTARQSLSPAERSVVVDLFCLAKRKNGSIDIPSRSAQAKMLLIPRRLLDETLQKAVKLDILSPQSDSESVLTTESFIVVNWPVYQGRSARKLGTSGATNDTEYADREEKN
jgi:hypothetical protein